MSHPSAHGELKPSPSQDESVKAPHHAQPAGRGCLRHFKKFWWVFLIGLVVVVVIAVPVILLVAVPHIIQHTLDKATLSVEGLDVHDMTPTSMHMAVNSTVRVSSSNKATVEPFNGDMYLTDLTDKRVFATLRFPETNTDAVQTVNVSQDVQLRDVPAFTTFNAWLLANDTLRVTIEGNPRVKVSGIARKYDAIFKKVIELKGLRSFAGFEISDSKIDLDDPEGKILRGHVNIPNYSTVSFEIGNVTFSATFNNSNIGQIYLANMYLQAGRDNLVDMAAKVDTDPVLNALDQKPYCENGGILPFSLVGTAVENRGQQLSYYAVPLSQETQVAPLNVGQALGFVPPCAGAATNVSTGA